jgi:ERCC4-type nuclease
MSSLYIDTTESRITSRLPRGVVQAAEIISGLEEYTGADMLLSPLSDPLLPIKITDILPHQSALKAHCQAGLLVQRKTGLDLIHSIPDLKLSLHKMQKYTLRPYLLAVGKLTHTKEGIALMDSKPSAQSTSYMEVVLALEKWQQRGGFITFLAGDNWIAPWINLWMEKLLAMPQIKVARPIYQRLTGPMEKDLHRETLMTLPGIREVLAQRVVDYAGDLRRCLEVVTSYHALELPHRPRGLGKKKIAEIKKYCGLGENEMLTACPDPYYQEGEGQ